MLMFGPARPKLPPHVKEGRNEAVGRPNQRSTPWRNPRSQPGARRREERGRPSEPGLFTFIIIIIIVILCFLKHSSRRTAVTVAVEV